MYYEHWIDKQKYFYGVISGPYLSVFSPNTGKYGQEITLYLDTFHDLGIIHHNSINQFWWDKTSSYFPQMQISVSELI